MISSSPISALSISSQAVYFTEGTLEVFLFPLKINKVQLFELELVY